MDDFAEFERRVDEALTHLYDPTFHPPEALSLQLGFRAPPPQDLIRERLTHAIEQLQPATEVPASARVRRIYDLLALRYLQEKTQKETALRLGITVRHLRREQQLAIHLLAERLWEQSHAQPSSTEQHTHTQPAAGEQNTPEQEDSDWRQQVRREIHVLQSNSPGVLANIQETLATISELADALTAGIAIVLDISPTPALWVATHPSVLREVLITAVEKLVPSLQAASKIYFSVQTHGERVEIKLSGGPAKLSQLPDSKFIDEVLDIYNGNFAVRQREDRVEFSFSLPLVKPVSVLVVDDNDDLVHFYRRYTEGTRYIIHHAAHGRQLWEQIETNAPDVIVLDVMLPDVGGWDVLRQLRKEPRTQHIPIIICSVIQQEELARTLGATLYLSKPTHRKDFLHALDTVINNPMDTSTNIGANPAPNPAVSSSPFRQQQFRDT